MKLPKLVVHLNVADNWSAFVLHEELLQLIDVIDKAIKMWEYDHLVHPVSFVQLPALYDTSLGQIPDTINGW